MNRILYLTMALALASCVQQKVVTPPPAVLPATPAGAAPAPALPVKTAAPAAKPKPVPKATPQPKVTPAPPPKPSAPAAAPAPLKPLRGTHSTIIQESDRVQSSRSMGGSATYAH
ncbi:MAG: hypothetical protein MJ051_05735 [Akkermansia sp.]|nr:hypothetical protein [Akkermansia sp.]